MADIEKNKAGNARLTDKIQAALARGDAEWISQSASPKGLSAVEMEVILFGAVSRNDPDCLSALLEKGFIPMRGGVCESRAQSKKGKILDLLIEYWEGWGEVPAAPPAKAEKRAPAAPAKKASDSSVKLVELERALAAREGELAAARKSCAALEKEIALMRSGRVNFNFDPPESAGFEEFLEAAQRSNVGGAAALAVESGDYMQLKNRINRMKPSKEHLSALFVEACESGNLALARVLLGSGADVDFMDNLPMIRACKAWKPDIVFWLARSGSDWHFACEYPLRCAARHGDAKACAGLWRMGAAVNVRNGAALTEALRGGHVEAALTLIDLGVNVCDAQGAVLKELADNPEIMERINSVREEEKKAASIRPLVLERAAANLGKEWTAREVKPNKQR